MTFASTRMSRLRFAGIYAGTGAAGIIVFSIMKEGRVNFPILIGGIIGTAVAALFYSNQKIDIVIGEGFVEGPVTSHLFSHRKKFALSAIDLGRSRRSFWKGAYLMTTTGEKIALNYYLLTSDQMRRIFTIIKERQSQEQVTKL